MKKPLTPMLAATFATLTALTTLAILPTLFFASCDGPDITGRSGTKLPDEPEESEDPETGQAVPFTGYFFAEGSGARWIGLGEHVDRSELNLLVIDSDDELSRHVEGDHPAVDFSRQMLLLAHGATLSGFRRASVDGLSRLSDGTFRMEVSVWMDVYAVIDRWVAAVTVDRIEAGIEAESEFEIDVKFPQISD
jgi:hypothetical protein